MRLVKIVEQWLEEQGWNEKPDVDTKEKSSSTNFTYKVGDFELECFFDTNENAEVFKLYMYAKQTVIPESKFDEVKKFIGLFNNAIFMGVIQYLDEQRMVAYVNSFDVEDATFEPRHISNMLSAGANIMEHILPKVMAISFGDKFASDVIGE